MPFPKWPLVEFNVGVEIGGLHLPFTTQGRVPEWQCRCTEPFTLQVKEPEEEAPGEVVLVMEQLDESPVTAQQIKAQTSKDPCLSVVRSWVMTGWLKIVVKYSLCRQGGLQSILAQTK